MNRHALPFADLDAATLYAFLRLRSDVFVVEQNCVYPDLDGRDQEPDTRHLWLAEDGEIAAYLRILLEPDGAARISRVCVDRRWRGKGLADELLAHAVTSIGARPARLSAQSPLVWLYAAHGFVVSGPEFMEDGIPHTPMDRP